MTEHTRIKYSASPTLARFHASDAFYRGVMGPVGSGKSTAMCMEIMGRARRQAKDSCGIRRSRWTVVRNSYRELQDTTLKTWLGWFPEHLFGAFNTSRMTHMIRQADMELEVLFRSLDRSGDVKKLLSLELTGAWFNEAREMPKAIIDAMGDRVERFPALKDGGCNWAGVVMDTNPPDTDHWWYRLAEEDRPVNWEFFCQPGGLLEHASDDGAFFVANPQAENIVHLPPEYYTKRMSGKSPDHVRVYYCSKYGFVQDGKAVYPEFHSSVHVSREDLSPLRERPVYVGIDFGLTPAAVFGQKLLSGRWQWLDELVTEDMGMVRFAELLATKCAADFHGCEFLLYGDPAGTQRSQVDERTPFDILRAMGIDARAAPTNDPLIRREAVALPLSRLVDGKPGLVISPKCRTLLKGMAGAYCYKRVQVLGDERYRDEPDKNRYSHVCDAAQYLMVGAGEGSKVTRAQQDQDRPNKTTNDFNPFERHNQRREAQRR
ncbi:MAG: hypothetical protein KKB70_04055 [Proteobacteria bacterium]|nr:hypothetical protein [Pseudomonadota bacterium]